MEIFDIKQEQLDIKDLELFKMESEEGNLGHEIKHEKLDNEELETIYMESNGVKTEDFIKVEKECEVKYDQFDIDIKVEVSDKDFLKAEGADVEHGKFKVMLKNYSCKYCSFSTNFVDIIKEHLSNTTLGKCFRQTMQWNDHTGEKIFKCELCQICFTNASLLADHKRIHMLLHDKRETRPTFKCELCEKYFIKSGQLTNHLVTAHTKETTFKCDLCKKCFDDSRLLTKHILLCHKGVNRPTIKCDLCKECFNEQRYLEIHMMLHHPGETETLFKCDLCNKCFNESKLLAIHMLRFHTGDTTTKCRKIKCDLCKLCFIESRHLTNHMRKYHPKTLFKCDICNKCFAHSSYLTAHKRIHTEEKQLIHTEEKQLIHTEEKQLISTEEKQLIHTEEKQLIHTEEKQRIHTEEKYVKLISSEPTQPNQRQIYTKIPILEPPEKVTTRPTKKHLWHHVKSVHNALRYNCDLCDYKTSINRHLHHHKKSVHAVAKIADTKICPKKSKLKLFCVRGCGSQFVNPNARDRHQSVCTSTGFLD